MFSYKNILFLLVSITVTSAMFYKKTENHNYEPDLVAVSSTVIPLSVYEVSYGIGGKPSEEYEKAYIKKLLKHAKLEEETDPDTLITIKKKYHPKKYSEKASVEKINPVKKI